MIDCVKYTYMDDTPLFRRWQKVTKRAIERKNKSHRKHKNQNGVTRDVGFNFETKFRDLTKRRSGTRIMKEERLELDLEEAEEKETPCEFHETEFEEKETLILSFISFADFYTRFFRGYNDDVTFDIEPSGDDMFYIPEEGD